MASVRIDSPGVSLVFTSNIDRITAAIERAAATKASRIANEVRNAAVIGMTGTRSGQRYRIPGTSKFYLASLPGQFPAVRLGQLRASVQTASTVANGIITAVVGSTLMYGLFLQVGTSRMKARPWLSLAFQNARPRVEAILKEPWDLK